MKNKNLTSGAVFFSLAAFVFIFSGCNGKIQESEREQIQNRDKNQLEKGDQNMEQKKDGSGGNGLGRMGNPSPEMLEACSGKSEGDSCEAARPPREGAEIDAEKIVGSCRKINQDTALVCAPTNMPQEGGRGSEIPAEE
ncbi:MAG: hypothetical protein V3574_04465 [Candidatus Moraniibacteriota bacterium]